MLIRKSGAWILVRQPIPVEIPIDPMSLWFAVPTGKVFYEGENHVAAFGAFSELRELALDINVQDDDYKEAIQQIYWRSKKATANIHDKIREHLNKKKVSFEEFEQQVQIQTLFGTVYLQPHEYTVVKDMAAYLENTKDGHAFLRFFGKSKSLTGKMADQLFYLRSRGISYTDSLQLLISQIKSATAFYIEMHPEYQRMFTREFEGYWMKKIRYLIKHDRIDLLDYGPQWSNEKFLTND